MIHASTGSAGRGWLAVAVLFGSLALLGMPLRLAAAPDKWAHPGLTVTNGLELWLDAGRLSAALRTNGQPELAYGQPVSTWFDASGHGRQQRGGGVVVEVQQVWGRAHDRGAGRLRGSGSASGGRRDKPCK